MPIEIRPYSGTSAELSEFVVRTWLASYAGKMVVPDWTAEYFDWQMTGEGIVDRDFLVTAWNDDELVGAVLGMPFPLWIRGEEHIGCHSSWLSVAADQRRSGVASQMANALREKERERGILARMGYAFRRSRVSQGPKFWKKFPTHTRPVRSVSLWARVLDPAAVGRWTDKQAERFLLQTLPSSLCNVARPDPAVSVRKYAVADLPECRELINNQAKRADIAVLWTADRLARQLEYGSLAHTLVVEREGRIVGFGNYHLLHMTLKGSISAAIIDLLACTELTGRETSALLRQLLRQMQEQGVQLALMREFYGQPVRSLVSNLFLPQWPESSLIVSFPGEHQIDNLPRLRKIHVLWR